jgi:hypothetical protein
MATSLRREGRARRPRPRWARLHPGRKGNTRRLVRRVDDRRSRTQQRDARSSSEAQKAAASEQQTRTRGERERSPTGTGKAQRSAGAGALARTQPAPSARAGNARGTLRAAHASRLRRCSAQPLEQPLARKAQVTCKAYTP